MHVDGSIVTVPPRFTRDAVFEAIEAGVKLIVIVTERIPRGEVAQMVELAKLRGARIIGPNCLGILSPDEAKMGGLGGPAVNVRRAFKKGPIGVMSRSGGMTTEIAQHAHRGRPRPVHRVSIGGDAIIGSTYAELMPLFEADAETKAIAIYSEPGGRMEAELADWVREHKSRLPIIAFMAGRFMDEMPGMRFGHAGTIVEGKADTTADKIERMKAAGISVAERIEDIPALVKERLQGGTEHDGGHVHRRRGRPRGRRTIAALAKKLVEVCPVNIFKQAADGTLADRRGEPRRVHALRPLHQGRARGHGAGHQAVRVASAPTVRPGGRAGGRVRAARPASADRGIWSISRPSIPPSASHRAATPPTGNFDRRRGCIPSRAACSAATPPQRLARVQRRLRADGLGLLVSATATGRSPCRRRFWAARARRALRRRRLRATRTAGAGRRLEASTVARPST